MPVRTQPEGKLTDTILIVDDELDLLQGLKRTVSMELDCEVLATDSASEALKTIRQQPVDVVLTDIRMPGMDGFSLLQAIKELDPSITVIIMTGYGTIEKAVEAIKAGAYDFIPKPFEEERLIHLLKNGLELNRLVRENSRLLEKLSEKTPFENMVGRSRPMLKAFNAIQMLAMTDVTVLIRGETGTGKDLAARAIHHSSKRSALPMVTVNCPALPESILESELFGYRKGAFTNASEDRQGLFDQAHGSSIFLDEIGDLSVPMQTKLLRVLQDKTIMPLGTNTSHKVDVRIIAVTNQDLEKKMAAHQFREDLYYRLDVATLSMPPLRDIREDIPLLVEHFLEKVARENKTAAKKVTPEVMNFLMQKEWPGNTRELENTIRGWSAMTLEPTITLKHVPITQPKHTLDPIAMDFDQPYKNLKEKVIEDFTMGYLYRLLKHTHGNVSLAAQISGIKRQSLQKIIKRYGVQVDQYRN
jgi:DNA-binding NtrC family response regulator